MRAYFEPVPHDNACDYCAGRRPITPLPAPLDAVYCISLQEQPHRTQAAAAHFHRIGICRHVTFYRPQRGKNTTRAIWESHRALAHDALAKGCRNALMLEDDVFFRQSWNKLSARIARVLPRLPSDWWCLYVSHIPLQAYFVQANIMRARSGSAVAYIAGTHLLNWLANNEPMSANIPLCRHIGNAIDGAMAELPGMYAMFPMAARQRFLGDRRIDTRIDGAGRRRSWFDGERWRYYFLFRGASVAEFFAVLFSPLHRLTLERRRGRSIARATEQVQLIRASGLFDSAYYLARRTDVAAAEADPLRHYLEYGAAEGSAPNPLFDPQYYAGQNPDLDGANPLTHYLRIGATRDCNPHPLFDGAFYRSRYAALIPEGMNPLAHYLSVGGLAGCDPHPRFDSAWYLSQQPRVRERGLNPLVHYLTEGWQKGVAPHPQFDAALYLEARPEAKAAGMSPLEHLVRHAQPNGRATS
jgi:GR25 family glycosyltransferase involved in LPS biosynthesis